MNIHIFMYIFYLICPPIILFLFYLHRLYIVCKSDFIDYQVELTKIKDSYTQCKSSNQSICLDSRFHIGTLFRQRQKSSGLNFNGLNGIIDFNFNEKYIKVGGKTTFHDITLFTLPYGLAPMVVPEFSTITIGGAISGIGIESSSFKFGHPHENVCSMDVLISSGKVVTCNRTNDFSDLFYAIPNSYGTLGYITSATIKLFPIKKFVSVTTKKFNDSSSLFLEMEKISKKEDVDFLECLVYKKVLDDNLSNEHVLVIGHLKDSLDNELFRLPEHKFDQLIKDDKPFCLSIYDYYWRWDTDMFWGTRNLPSIFHHPFVRKTLGRSFFNSRNILRLRSWLSTISENPKNEKIIQDIGIPINNCAHFLDWLDQHIKIYPLWICPLKTSETNKSILWRLNDGQLYCDFGIFGRIKHDDDQPFHQYTDNKLIEQKMIEFGGKKCFYSDTFYDRPTFDKQHHGSEYNEIKVKYDSDNLLSHVYDKCIYSSK